MLCGMSSDWARRLLVASVILCVSTALSQPGDPEIVGFSMPGRVLTWTNAFGNGVATLEHCTNLEQGAWLPVTHVFTSNSLVTHLLPTGVTARASYYRIVAADVSGAPQGMVLVPEGGFLMGDLLQEGYSSELPVHRVHVSGFYMDECEVSKGRWVAVADWATNNGYDISSAGGTGREHHPAHFVSWFECVKWCNARSEMEGRAPAYYTSPSKTSVYRTGTLDLQNDCVRWDSGYRLPTEAEWEKAARGGMTGRRFPWGSAVQHARANYYSSAQFSYDTSPTRGFHPDHDFGKYPFTSPTGGFPSNRYGLHDIVGNVAEWCWDWLDVNYYASSPAVDPRGAATGSYRVFRGGDWSTSSFADRCRNAFRYGNSPYGSNDRMGFRTVLPSE